MKKIVKKSLILWFVSGKSFSSQGKGFKLLGQIITLESSIGKIHHASFAQFTQKIKKYMKFDTFGQCD